MRERPMLLFACIFLTGLAYQRYENPWLLCVLLIAVAQEIYYGMSKMQMKDTAGRSILLLSAFLLGVLHMHGEEAFRNAYLSKLEDDSTAVIWGAIKKIEQTEHSFRLILSDSYISLNDEVIPCNDVMVYTSSNHFQVGEIHKITGKVNKFQEARNLGNFDSRVFYRSQKIDFCVYEESGIRLGKKESWSGEFLLELKQRLQQVFECSMNKNAAGFFAAMLLGDKINLSEQLKDLFQVGGISHILAISGLHVSILGRSVYKWLRKWRWSFWSSGLCAGILLLGYCYMVDSGMSAVRAVGMMILFFLAQFLGRSYDMLNGLGAMCVFLLWENPFLLEYSGFWFSVTALLGVGFVGPALSSEGTGKQPVNGQIGEEKKGKKQKTFDVGMNIGITLASLPVAACCYYEIPMYSTLVNMIVLPILPFVFGLSVIGGLVGIFYLPLANVILLPCEWGLCFYEWICTVVEGLPCASIITGAPSLVQVVVYYIVLITGVCCIKRWKKKMHEMNKGLERVSSQKVLWGKIALTTFCFALLFFPKGKPFEITFLDVGQGDGIYISAGDGTTYFIDGGSSNVSSVGEYRILPFLKYKGVSEIDYWFVSHADTDHISGLVEVLESGYKVRNLVIAEACPRDENYESLITLTKNSETNLIHMNAGDCIVSEYTTMSCLYPGKKEFEEENLAAEYASVDRNDLSMVLLFEAQINDKDFGEAGAADDVNTRSFTALFSGDCSAEVEQLLVGAAWGDEKNSLPQVNLLKAAHHGSNYSNSEALLSALMPEVIVVSCSATNNYGHPGAEAVARMKKVGAEVYYTMAGGQITFRIEKGRMKIDELIQ